MESIGDLIGRRIGTEPTQTQFDTLVEIRGLLKDEERDKAKDLAFTLKGSGLWLELLLLFLKEYPVHGNCQCGEKVQGLVHPLTLVEQFRCKPCLQKDVELCLEMEVDAVKYEIMGKAVKILRENGVPSMFANVSICDYPPSAMKWVNMKKGLYITGARGTGKTHLAVALMKEHLHNVNVVGEIGKLKVDIKSIPLFVSIPEMLLEIRQSYQDSKASDKFIIDKYTHRDFMVLDDLGVEKTTEWSLQILYIIIDRRYRDEKRTIITSNLTLDELADKLDDRIASRIAGMCVYLEWEGEDRRLKND